MGDSTHQPASGGTLEDAARSADDSVSEQAVAMGERSGRRPGGHAELEEDVAQVAVDGLLAPEQGLGDGTVGVARGHQAEDLQLPGAEASRIALPGQGIYILDGLAL